MNRIRVIDFFCGGGGFSEGFRQHGFEIVRGYDNWRPAVETYSYNFSGRGILKNILDFEGSLIEIDGIPDTEVILGSPPCVSFSNSNKSGKADKSMGLRLTEVFLRIVAVKKHQKNSILKAWIMENVTNSLKYIKHQYTFKELGLEAWASKIGLDPKDIAINVHENSTVINSADYGSPQIRKRAITGEFIGKNKSITPPKKFRSIKERGALPKYKTLKTIKQALPSPYSFIKDKMVNDPNYGFSLSHQYLTDHFYDTGLYECEWKCSRFHKINHPYMGKMAFPENLEKPSRTICATNIGTSRESLIYKCELERKGDGEYRSPTVREAACIMGFPISYQFTGSESAKWRMVGNAVSPSVSRAFAESILRRMRRVPPPIQVEKAVNLVQVNNLNGPILKSFAEPPKKKKGSRFRRHPFKYGNITVTLSNYDIIRNVIDGKWITSVQYGNGDGFPTFNYPDNYYLKLEKVIKGLENGKDFLRIMNNGFQRKIANGKMLQQIYEDRSHQNQLLEPTVLVEHVADIIEQFTFKEENLDFEQNNIFQKKLVPKKQIMALYAINLVSTKANQS